MALTPWYKLVTPRDDLRGGKPLDASEFAVHLDHVRVGTAPSVYQDPAEFFERTYLTRALTDLATQVIRRLNGIQVETSAVFNLSTQFGGGKTHALTLLYHLARHGQNANGWNGVQSLLNNAGVAAIPQAATAVFVGTEFDSISGRGGTDDASIRLTPWGEIAYQLGGNEGFRLVEQHVQRLTAPGGDVIQAMLPQDRPTLILIDEVMNYVSRYREMGLAAQFYNFLQNLSETVRSRNNVVLAVSIPASLLEMNPADESDFERFKKLLDRLGKAMVMSAESESSEIIRRRLFEWSALPEGALSTIRAYAEWFRNNKSQLPGWFPADNAAHILRAVYPFHPSALTVFERKWQSLPRFQRTRGVLRMLALWVARAYRQGYSGAHRDPLISLGTAPVDDAQFRAAVFEQLGELKLETAVTTDIAGKDYAHAVRLDEESEREIKRARLHQKTATSVFFESNGGQQRGGATLPEIRLAVAEPDLDIGNVEHCLETLTSACYYLTLESNKYRFSFQPNLNKILADRIAVVSQDEIDKQVRKEIQAVFSKGKSIDQIFFPESSGQIPNHPALTLVILPPEAAAGDAATQQTIMDLTKNYGATGRTFKSALIWSVSDSPAGIADEARKLLAWTSIKEDDGLKLDDSQKGQLPGNVKKAATALREAIWRSYRHVFLLGDGDTLEHLDLGLVHSSSADSIPALILSRMDYRDLATEQIKPEVVIEHWPPALPEWSTQSVRDAFYSSPKLPRPLVAAKIPAMISLGIKNGLFAYVGKSASDEYNPFLFRTDLDAGDVEISNSRYLIRAADAVAWQERSAAKVETVEDDGTTDKITVLKPDEPPKITDQKVVDPKKVTIIEKVNTVAGFQWHGSLPPQKWMSFYTKLLQRYVQGGGVKLEINLSILPSEGMSADNAEYLKIALREIGLEGSFEIVENKTDASAESKLFPSE